MDCEFKTIGSSHNIYVATDGLYQLIYFSMNMSACIAFVRAWIK